MTDTQPSTASNLVEDIERLSKLARELADKIRDHRDMLARRGMSVPANAVEGLQGVSLVLAQLLNRFDNSQIELEQLRGLARTLELINSSRELDMVLDEVVDTVIILTGAERGYIVLKDPSTGQLAFRVARDNRQRKILEAEFVVSRTIVERVANEGELVVTNNATEDTRFASSDSIAGFVLRSILCVPLKRKGDVTGVIYVDNRARQGLFGEREQRLVTAFANQAAVAIENARLFEHVRKNIAEITAIRDLMENVFASIASGVITTDAQDKITMLNVAAARILTITQEEVIGQSLWSVLPPIYDGFDALVQEVREHKRIQTVEVDPVLASRGQISLNLKLSPLKEDEQVTRGVAIVLDDLTDLKQRQAQLSAVRRYLPPALVDNIKTIDELELGGVEREISILFCDVRGFTTFSEALQPEDVMQTINQYLTVSSDAINHYEGIIDKYMGDAVVGLFNTQLNPQSEHALRAVYAAMMMVQNVQALHSSLPPDKRLLYGIGVHTGSAVLGNVGSPRRKEFTAIGGSLLLAKALQENALGGEVILSQDTYNIVKDKVTAEPIEPRKDKDQRDYSVIYRVTGLVR
jgi:PAS domain S-box-containing protein